MNVPVSRKALLTKRGQQTNRRIIASLLNNDNHSHERFHIPSLPLSRSHYFSSTTTSHKSMLPPPSNRHTKDPKSLTAATATPFDYEVIRKEIFNYWIKAHASSPLGQASSRTARYCSYTHDDAKRTYLNPSTPWHWLDGELSSNLAGETGAVYIYKGAMDAIRLRPPPQQDGSAAAGGGVELHPVEEFVQQHKKTEESHLQMFEYIVPKAKRTRLLSIWKMAGWTLGFVPTLVGGSKALYVTVEAVETFVQEHFEEQIHRLQMEHECLHLVQLLQHCCEDEIHHKHDAKEKLLSSKDFDEDALVVKAWATIVKVGSAVAADIARRI